MIIEKVIDAIVCDRVPCKQALSWRAARGGCIGTLSGTTSKEGSWEGLGRGKLTCAVGAAKVRADSIWSSGAEWPCEGVLH